MAGQKAENSELKAINASQQAQISDLAKKANALQDQMAEINRIEAELQQLSGGEWVDVCKGWQNEIPSPIWSD